MQESYGRAQVDAVNLAERELRSWKARDFSELEALVGHPQNYSRDYSGKEFAVQVSAERLSSDLASAEYRVLALTVDLDWQEKKTIDQDARGRSSLQKAASHLDLRTMVSAGGAF